MSRIGKMPITVPDGTAVSFAGNVLTVRGALGTLTREISDLVRISEEGSVLRVEPANESRRAQAMWGTTRSLVNNMVEGVSKGFERRLNLVGVGYRATAQDNSALNLTLGFSHPVSYRMPEGVTCETPTVTEIILRGIDKQVVGQAAAEIRAFRKPEPYKGKGIRFANEVIAFKETKKK